MQNDPNHYGPPPASQQEIDTLQLLNPPVRYRRAGKLTKGVDQCSDCIAEDKIAIECSVCKEKLEAEKLAVDMPRFHQFQKKF